MSARVHDISRDPPFIVPPVPEDGVSPEIYRQLFISIGLQAAEHPVIGITSAISGEGRTTVALGLARTLALDLESTVTLVDVDLENASLTTRFGAEASSGLAEVLRGDALLPDVQADVVEHLEFVPAGRRGTDSPGLLRRLSLEDPFHGLHPLHGVVILDLPPILNHAYSSVAAQVADAVILVVRAGVTPIDMVREAIARLEDRPPVGVVFNAPRSALPSWWPGTDQIRS